jgi:thiamine biosynthesis lipoprotein ApbE
LLSIGIADEAAAGVATSGVNRRRWRAGGRPMHHLIDPSTGRPLAGGASQVTVFAPSVGAAEVAAKALLVAAARGEPLDPVDAAAAVLAFPDGRVEFVPGSCPDACVTVSSRQLAQPRRSA